jgi:hypothetical protein
MHGSAIGQSQADQRDHTEVAPTSLPVKTSRFSQPKKAPLPHSHRHERFTLATVEAALRKHKGMVARAARALRCTPQTIRNYMQRHPAIAQVVADERELIVDLAEVKLNAAVQRGEAWAVCFTLKCLGKDRGYIERQERTGAGGQPLVPDREAIIITGNKEEYIAKLRAMRGAPPIAPTGVRPVPLSGDGHDSNGDGPG